MNFQSNSEPLPSQIWAILSASKITTDSLHLRTAIFCHPFVFSFYFCELLKTNVLSGFSMISAIRSLNKQIYPGFSGARNMLSCLIQEPCTQVWIENQPGINSFPHLSHLNGTGGGGPLSQTYGKHSYLLIVTFVLFEETLCICNRRTRDYYY